jgi:hypothetical protein
MALKTVPESMDGSAAPKSLASKQAGYVISDIAFLADAIRGLCVDVINESDAAWGNDVVNKIVAARELCSQIGVLADIANADLGNDDMRLHHDPRKWLCSPAYHELAEARERGHA